MYLHISIPTPLLKNMNSKNKIFYISAHANARQTESHIKNKHIQKSKDSRTNSEHQKTPRHCKCCHCQITVTFEHVEVDQAYSENYKAETQRNWVTTCLNQSVGGHQCSHEPVGVQNQKLLKCIRDIKMCRC